ncbi:MAG: arginine decarboxylase [Flavobacteriales bacterium CG03_land_8_20_14_0_80_35_15]|nr:MAG: arginine decarboxylase [Flavobacteriales bacterium CG11_big_fil_rev_8_21_14_0_20_35_7]PIV18238.1 MAG: arginine decarboxylase [Flavobacteriales bacterium CG03_land_8_20_14_0_80_35_15]PIX06572.1 MAG: arginine decarboxylase [Flavobacteriales bacterium CG_4_8_14_3_um_filter_35_10]PJA05191.1 MAG: arginine decarboxylase [Flavobacteriales bacterium CG_4_10_14_0_2_um_filter_35_18]
MKNTYFDLIDQSYYFPQEGFDLKNGNLTFHGISLKHLIKKYGTPFRFIYLPKIGDQIKKARNLFNRAIKKQNYKGKYNFCYCTKCNHFSHVVSEALKHNVNLETSSSFDIDLILSLLSEKKIDKKRIIICNGYKTTEYLQKIVSIQKMGFSNIIVVLDSKSELEKLLSVSEDQIIKIGMRMAINEEPQSAYYTSRLGIRQNEIINFFKTNIKGNKKVELKMLHFFVDSGIKDSPYYWGEFQKALKTYIDLKKESQTLDSFNLGGGFPIRNNLGFAYDYEYMINEIVINIKEACTNSKVPEPNIYTEFGKYTVGESGAIIFEVLEQKHQNDTEIWYIINNSLMNTIPDAWSIHEKFILLPINKWDNEYSRVNIGGISCDHSDYYNSEDLNQEVFLPTYSKEDKEPLYLGFFHTGAYQDAISGYGGIKHCLIPSPKHVIIDRDDKGNIVDYVYRNEQSFEDMFKLLGYNK